MKEKFEVGDNVAISPDLTFKYDWVTGKVIDVEENPYVGTVLSAELPESGEIFFGRADNFINLGDLDEEEEENEDEDEEYEYDEEEDSE